MSNRENLQENGEIMNRETEIEGSGNINGPVHEAAKLQHSNNDNHEGERRTNKRIILRHVWNYVFLFSCVIAAIVDPLFFYIPLINDSKRCLLLEKKLWIAVFVFRIVTDVIYLVHMVLRSWMDFKICVKTRSNICCSNTNVCASVRRCFSFLIDVFVVLPIPQVVFPVIFKEMRSTRPSAIIKALNALVLFQYVPRIRQIYLTWKNLPRNAGKFDGWIKAAFNFFLYILASHVIGAFWYFFSIEREIACWHFVCGNQNGCGRNSFSCANSSGNYTSLDASCPINTPNTTLFDFGIFLEALQSGIVQSSSLPQKFFFCFWWGLRNLSSFGQGLQTSNNLWESCFAIFISIFGLLLFLYFLENLKTYMRLATKSSEEDRKKAEKERRKEKQEEEKKKLADQRQNKQKKAKDDIQVWIQKNEFCDDIKNRINEIVDEVLEEDINVNAENLFLVLPAKLKNDIKSHLCLDILRNVPVLRERMNEPELKMICDCLKPVSYEECIYIVREGEPLDRAYFITRGTAWTYTTTCTNGEATTSSSQSKWLEKGGFFGEELIEWGLDLGEQASSDIFNLPLSSKIFKSHTKVEAYALMANDLKNIVSQINDAASKLHAALGHNKEN